MELSINGQLGDLVFYKRGNTDVVRQKAAHKQQTEASKKSSRDFGSTSRNAAYIRKHLHLWSNFMLMAIS
ncbi:hypothetical protein [Pedobacter sp. P26]|uniref:hypothetical protein n=1 Tax=Pedobacter sp. P26 TaxID=3423956 RepID=UPI003D672A03